MSPDPKSTSSALIHDLGLFWFRKAPCEVVEDDGEETRPSIVDVSVTSVGFRRVQTQVLYQWVEPKICVENITGAVELPAMGQREPCPPCNPGYYNSNDSTCLPCPPGTHSDGTNGKPAHTLHASLPRRWCCIYMIGAFLMYTDTVIPHKWKNTIFIHVFI